MPNVITAGNSSNGGTAISTDTSGTLNIVTGSGSGANAITIDASQNVTTGANLTVTGTLTASGGVSGGIRSGTAVASTSGTSIDFTSLPTGIKRITVMFSGVSTSGTSPPQIQIGDSGGVETTGYAGTSSAIAGGTAQAVFTTGFGLGVNTSNWSSAVTVSGAVTITLLNSSTNNWVASGSLGRSDATGSTYFTSGGKSLSDVLDRVRITTVNGTDTFDAGTINIFYE